MKRWFASTLVMALMSSLLIGCTGNGGSAEEPNEGDQEAPVVTEETTYPIETDVTLSYWGELPGNLIGVKATHDEVPFFRSGKRQPEFRCPIPRLHPDRLKRHSMSCLPPGICQT